IQNELDLWSLRNRKISINGLEQNLPEAWLQTTGDGKLVFLQRKAQPPDTTSNGPLLGDIEMLAPSMNITDRTLHLQNIGRNSGTLERPASMTISEINADFFLEWSEKQRFLDIESFSAKTNDLELNRLSMTGQ